MKSNSIWSAFLLSAFVLFGCSVTGFSYEAGYYNFSSPSGLPVGINSLVMRATQVDVPAGATFSVHLLRNNAVISTSKLVFTSSYKNLTLFTGAPVASFRPTGTNEAPGEIFPGAKLFAGTVDLNALQTAPEEYRFFWELSDGFIAPKDRLLVTSGSSFAFVNLALTGVAAAARQSDQKPGSVLFYHRYTSSLTQAQQQNTTLTITNTSIAETVSVRMFFINAADCQPYQFGLCLAPQQTSSFLMSDFDPGISGYCIAFACDAEGKPTQANWLIGSAQVRQLNPLTNQPFDTTLSAVAIAKRTAGSVSVSNEKSTMNFDDEMYDRLPNQLAADNIPAQTNHATTLALYRPLTDLSGGISNPRATFTAFSAQASTNASQLLGCYANVRLGSLRFNPLLNNVITDGRIGWVKIAASDNGAILGAQFTNGTFSSGTTLRALTYAPTFSISVPLQAPGC